jgi:hypothetical protein
MNQKRKKERRVSRVHSIRIALGRLGGIRLYTLGLKQNGLLKSTVNWKY